MAESRPEAGLLYTDEWLPDSMRPATETAQNEVIVFDPSQRLQELLQLKRCTPCGAGNDDGDPTPHIDAQIGSLLDQHPELRQQVQ